MTRSTDERIADVLDAIGRCQRYADSLESSDDVIAEMAADAVERNLQIIGEAVTQPSRPRARCGFRMFRPVIGVPFRRCDSVE